MINQKKILAIALTLFVFAVIGLGLRVNIPEAFALQQFIGEEHTFDAHTTYKKYKVKSGDISLPEPVKHCSFKIDIENKANQYRITLKSPSGSVYSTEEPGEIIEHEGSYTVTIPQAEKGTWICEVEGFEIGKVRVEVGETPDYIRIDKLSYNRDNETISWQLSYAIGRVHFQLVAVTDEGKISLTEFSSDKAAGTAKLEQTCLPQGTSAIELIVLDELSVPDTYTISI